MENLLKKLDINPERLMNKIDNKKGVVDTYTDLNFNIEFNSKRENLRREYRQSMTWYGKSKGEFGAEINDTSGMSTKCLLPDGQVSINKMIDVVRAEGAQTESAIGSFHSKIKSWDWCDSQIGLLVNMIRYAMIMRLEEKSDLKFGEKQRWDDYEQDGIRINRDHMMKPIERKEFFWPGGEYADAYPETCVIAGELYNHSDDSINVAMLKQFEARFVILMLSKWERQTNYLLDFSLDKLVDRIMFRAEKNDDIPNITDWTKEEEGDEFYDEVPRRLTSEEAWNVVFKYVKANRLYRQYWHAMCILNQVTAQFLPTGLEAQAWLDNEIGVKIPKFRACRGRLTFLIKDKPALLGDREYYSWLNSSKYIDCNLVMGLIMGQIIGTGLGVINIRQNMEYENPKMTLGINERTRPGSGIVWAVSEAVKMIEPNLANRDSYLFFDTEITTWNKERDVRINVIETGKYRRMIKRRGGHNYIAVPIMPMPGIPTMIMPIHPFPKQDPLSLNGVIRNGEERRINESGKMTTTPYQSWECAWFANMTGKTIRPISAHGFYSTEIYKPEDDFTWVWPLPRNKEFREEKVAFVKHDEVKIKGKRTSKLPDVTQLYPDFKLTYNGSVISKGTICDGNKSRIFEARDIPHRYNSKEYIIRVEGEVETREAWAAEAGVLRQACEACCGWKSGFKVNKEMECYSCGRKYIDWRTRIFLRRKEEYKVKIMNVSPRGIESKRNKMRQMTVDHGFGVPVWVNLDEYILTSVDRREATHVLIHIEKGDEGVKGDNIIIIGNEAIRVVSVRVGTLTAHYMKVNVDINTVPEIVRQRISVAFSMINEYDYGDEDGTSTVIEMLKPNIKLVGQKKRDTWYGEFEQSKITQSHHTHLKPEEIAEVMKDDEFRRELMYDLLSNIRKLSNPHESMVSGMMLYIATAEEHFATMFTYSEAIWGGTKSVEELFEKLKKVSTPMKGLQNGRWVDLTQLFELQTMINRGVGTVDWDEEKYNRLKANVAIVEPQEIYKAAREVFKMGKDHGFKYRKMNLDNYLRSRWEWAPTGSVHSQHEEDDKYIYKEHLHKTKFVTLCSMDIQHLRSIFSREPEIHAWTSIKYEWGKQRAIYGVDLTSTVITNFAMYACEEVFKHRFPVGEEAESERVHRRLTEMLKNKDCLCYDFDDFNSQHKYESMKAVLIAYKAEFERDMTPEQRVAMDWVINSIDNVTVHCKETGDYKIKDTLLSGWRLTTFMNTVLNYAYFKAAGVFDIKGIKDSVHNGDDVCLAVDSLKSAVETYEKMESINARAQPLKCNLFSTGEFLRIDHKVKNKYGGAQYLSRACATAVHARTESNEPDRFRSGLAAIVTRAKELEKRSEKAAQYTEELVMIQVRRLCKIFEVKEGDAIIMMRQHVVNGGISIDKNAETDYVISEEVGSFDELTSQGAAKVIDLMPGVQDYSYRLYQMFKEKVTITGILSQVKAATRDQIAKGRYTKLVIKEDRMKFGEMKLRVFKKYKGAIRIPYADRARFLNISPIVLLPPELVIIANRLIGEGVDVLEEIKILF